MTHGCFHGIRRRLVLLSLLLVLCLALSSCSFSLESMLKELKAYINGEEISQPPADFVASRENDEFAYDVYKTYVVITAYLGEDVEVKIPKKIEDTPVKVIAGLAFYESVEVESVEVPEGVTTLEDNAFYYCKSLKSVSLPESLETVGDKAFSWCSSLESIYLPDSITVIPDYCFNECTALKYVVCSDRLAKVGARAFSGCASLESLSFGDKLSFLGNYAFRGCVALKSVTLPGDCIPEENAFADRGEGLYVVTQPDSPCWVACTEREIPVSESVAVEIPDDTSSDDTEDTETSEEI